MPEETFLKRKMSEKGGWKPSEAAREGQRLEQQQKSNRICGKDS
jgi:hypothetical protein